MLGCDNCVKRDVCGKCIEAKKYIETLGFMYEFQELQKLNIKISFACENKLVENKIIRGEK